MPNYESKEKNRQITPKIKKKQRMVREPKERTHNRLDSPAESPVMLFRTMHPCNLGSLGLPTYLATCKQSAYVEIEIRIGRKLGKPGL